MSDEPKTRPVLVAKPVKDPDYEAIRKEIFEKFKKTLDYLAKH